MTFTPGLRPACTPHRPLSLDRTATTADGPTFDLTAFG